MNRKLMIVIEEDGSNGGKGFKLYLDGDKERLNHIEQDQMSPAEFWGMALFKICANAVMNSGAMQSVNVPNPRRPNAPGSDEIQ